MVSRNQKNQNALNIFLNDYFNVLVAVALIVFLGLAYLIFLGPKFTETQATIQANNDQGKNLYASSLKKLASYKAMDAIYQKINKDDLRRFNSVLPDNYVPERLFGEIEEMVSQGNWLISGLKINQPVDPSAAEGGTSALVTGPDDKKLGRYNLELSIATINYGGLKSLLRIFENNLRLFDVTSVDYSPTEERATIILTTYYYKIAP